MKTERLGDLAKFLSGFAFKSNLFNDEGKGMPIIRIRDVIRGRSETYFSGEYDERYLVKSGDYLIGMDGEFNLARWNSEPALLNQRVCKIDSVSRSIDRAYLGRFLPAALKKIEDATPFVTVKHLSVKTLNDIEIPPVETLEESVGIEVPKETLEQRRTRLKDVIARKKELAAEFRKRQKEKTMRLRERPKTKEAPATEVKSEALKRQENIKEIMDKQEKLLEKADSYFEKGVYDAKELKARIKEITEQTNLALSKFKRGGEV